MRRFRFDFVDIFRAPRLALSAKKIWIQFRALALALVIYDVFAYLALAVSGEHVVQVWRTYYLFPPVCVWDGVFVLSAAGVVLWVVGFAAFLIVAFLAMAAVAKVTIEQLRGNDFYSRREAGRFVRRHWRPVIFTPVALAVTLALLFGAGLLVGVVGMVPWFGDIFASLLTVPLYLGALLFLFLAVVLAFSLCLTPAVVATTGDDTFETSFELYSTLAAQPWRLAVYELLTAGLVTVAHLAFAFVSYAAVRVAYTALYIPMGDKAAATFGAAWRVMPCWLKGAYCGPSPFWGWLADRLGAVGVSAPAVALPLPWPQAIGATLVSLGLLVILGIVVAYAMNVCTAAQTIIYTILRKKKDDENLLEMYDDELEQAMRELEEGRAQPEASGGYADRDENGGEV